MRSYFFIFDQPVALTVRSTVIKFGESAREYVLLSEDAA